MWLHLPAHVSIFVNGSPTVEFVMEKGLRQGDPLSAFLFILVAHALSVMMREAVEKGMFKGEKIGRNAVEVTHLQFADDVLFMGEWFAGNAMNLLKCVKWFEAASE